MEAYHVDDEHPNGALEKIQLGPKGEIDMFVMICVFEEKNIAYLLKNDAILMCRSILGVVRGGVIFGKFKFLFY